MVTVLRRSPGSNTKDSRRLVPYRYATEVVLSRLSVCCNSCRNRCGECVLIRIVIIIAEGLNKNQLGKKFDHIPCSKPHIAYTHLQYCIMPYRHEMLLQMEIHTSGSTSHLSGHNKAFGVTVCHYSYKILSDAQYQLS